MEESMFVFLPPALKRIVHRIPADVRLQLEEMRVREGRPLEVIYRGSYRFVSYQGELLESLSEAYRPTREDCATLLDLLTNHSLYTFEEELQKGFITVAGGHRVGLAGKTVLERGKVKLLRDISSFNIRLAREVKDVGKSVIPHLWDEQAGVIHHTLVISPPQQGKTTLIRDMARLLSSGEWRDRPVRSSGLKVGIVDERSEIAACIKGIPCFDVGPRTDVLDGCPKAEGMLMMIRSMSPQVLIVDEIGRPEDATAVQEALHAGIRVVATAHAADAEDAKRRPILRQLLDDRVFARFVVLRREKDGRTVQSVVDDKGQPLTLTAVRDKSGKGGTVTC